MSKVFLGVGHGGSDPGAVKYIREADVNLSMALACRDYLASNGVEVKMSRTRDENDPLTEEIKECNAYEPDLAVDIHNNAGGGDGFEVYHTIGGGKGKELAQNIEKEIIAINQNSRGCKTKKNSRGKDYYGFIRQTKCPAVIVEGVFVDNQKDASQADTLEEQKAFGVAYAKGILKTLGITEKNVSQVNKNGNTTATSVSTSYTVKITASVLNVRAEAGTDNKINTKVKKGEVYTIVEEKMNGNNKWGKLKSGAGWISLDYTELYKNKTTVQPNEYYPSCNRSHTSLIDALKSIGVDSSYNNRKKIAQKNNIINYSGTAVQNSRILEKLKAGKLKKV